MILVFEEIRRVVELVAGLRLRGLMGNNVPGLPRVARGVLAGWTGTLRMLGDGLGALEGLGLVLGVRVGRAVAWLAFKHKLRVNSW